MNDNEILNVLRSIDASLKQMLKRTAAAPEVADDRDLDGQYGNPEVKFMPRDWTGESFKGEPMSACPPALLDMLAETFDYFAKKAEDANELTSSGKPVAPYKRKDASRARGWAKRLRNGYRPTTRTQEAQDEPVGAFADGGSTWPEDSEPFN